LLGEHESLLGNEDRVELQTLRAEGSSEAEVTLLGVQLAIEAMVNQQAKEDIEAARAANAQGRKLAGETNTSSAVTMLAGESIGWLASNGPLTVPVERIEKDGIGYWFGAITDKHRVTKDAMARLERQGKAEKLINHLKTNALPQFIRNLKEGSRKLRPISKGTRGAKKVDPAQSLNTKYPAYKMDVEGTNNRAIVLLPGKRDDSGRQEQIIILAALYDHEDQAKIYSALFLKGK
jgi:hypothetical protein